MGGWMRSGSGPLPRAGGIVDASNFKLRHDRFSWLLAKMENRHLGRKRGGDVACLPFAFENWVSVFNTRFFALGLRLARKGIRREEGRSFSYPRGCRRGELLPLSRAPYGFERLDPARPFFVPRDRSRFPRWIGRSGKCCILFRRRSAFPSTGKIHVAYFCGK